MNSIDPMKRTLLKFIGLGTLAGCASAKAQGRSVSAIPINYTDRYIADVMIDGTWAGSANAYGGEGNRIEGFIAPTDPNKRVVLKVTWVVGSQYEVATNQYSRRPPEPREANVELPVPHPANPSYLILHFYPDGHVEAELSSDLPKRRIPRPTGYHR